MANASYDFYQNVYLGVAIKSSEDFVRLSGRAYDYVYSFTKGRSEKVTGKDAEMVKKAVCAIAEIFQDEQKMTENAFSDEKAVSSETVGSWSRSYKTVSFSASEADYLDGRKREALLLYLGNIRAFSGIFRVQSYPCVHKARRY